MSNAWCQQLGIEPPRLEQVASHREANTFSLLLVALLERGEPMTLPEVAERFVAAGVMDATRALRSLQRCKPARAPVYRDGDAYHLDPHDATLSLWLFRLDLLPARVAVALAPKPPPAPLPGPDVPLTAGELDVAWKDASLFGWSLQRLVLAVLDVADGPLPPRRVVEAVSSRTPWHLLREETTSFLRRGSPVRVLDDGRWKVSDDAGATVSATRDAVRRRVAAMQRHTGPDPTVLAAARAENARRREALGAELDALRRAIVVTAPAKHPSAAALLDVGARTIRTFVGPELADLPAALEPFDLLAGVDVRTALRTLGVDPGLRRLADLGPPQKTIQLNRSGRTLKITVAMLVQGSCGLSSPFGAPGALVRYLEAGEVAKARRRLEADAKALHALHAYGRLHGMVRLRWGFLDEMLPAPWAQPDERKLYELKRIALEHGLHLEAVVGRAPAWDDPWSRALRLRAVPYREGWRTWLVDAAGAAVDDADVQAVRLVGPEDDALWS